MDTTPDTLGFMISGYVVFAVVMGSYIASLISRWNNLKREKQMLDDLEKQK